MAGLWPWRTSNALWTAPGRWTAPLRANTAAGAIEVYAHPMCREMEMIVSSGPVVTAYPLSADGAALAEIGDMLRDESLAGRVVDFAVISYRAYARFLRQMERYGSHGAGRPFRYLANTDGVFSRIDPS